MPKSDHPFIHRLPVKDRDGRTVDEKEVIAYQGLLDLAHRAGLSLIRTKLLQLPTKENGETAIVQATVRTKKGLFTAIGDANPRNVNVRVAPHFIRMAETRAEARAMRKAVNIGVVSLEEFREDLSDGTTSEGTVGPVDQGSTTEDPGASAEPAPAPKNETRPTTPSEEQRRYLYRLLRERGIEGEAAREYLHRELKVESFTQASRGAVSALIDRLKANGHGAEKHQENGQNHG